MLNENIARLRKSKGLTQVEFAKQLHVTQSAVSHWESGRSVPDTVQLFNLATFFGTTIEELSSENPKETGLIIQEKEVATTPEGSDDTIQILMPRTDNGRSMYSQLSPEDRAVIDSMVRALFEKSFGKDNA